MVPNSMRGQHPRVEVSLHGQQTATELAGRIWPCYRAAFGDFDDLETWRRDMFDRHAQRAGYRLTVGMDGNTVAGFAWGYIGQRGQYWSDLICEMLPREAAEIIELPDVPADIRAAMTGDWVSAWIRVKAERLLSCADEAAKL
jgi:hypothetical protein